MNDFNVPKREDETANGGFVSSIFKEIGKGLADGALSTAKWTLYGVLFGGVLGFVLTGAYFLLGAHAAGSAALTLALIGGLVGAVVGGVGVLVLVFAS